MAEQITYQSVPDLDELDFFFFEDTYWGCSQWVTYHKELVKHYGLEQADKIFETEWLKQNTAVAWPYSFCKYDADFTNYFNNNSSLDVGHFLSDTLVTGQNIVTNVAQGAETTSKIIKYILPVAIIAYLGFKLYKSA